MLYPTKLISRGSPFLDPGHRHRIISSLPRRDVLLVGLLAQMAAIIGAHSFYALIDGKKVIGELFYEGLDHLGNSTCHLLADYCNLHSVPCTRGHLLLRSVYQ